MPLPPFEEQKRIVNRIESLLMAAETLSDKLEKKVVLV